MYRTAFMITHNKLAALLGGIVYLTAPYYIIVVDELGNLNEALALGIIPAALYYSLKYYEQPHSYKLFLQTSLVWYLLITIHIVTFIYFALFFSILCLLMTLINLKQWRNLLFIVFVICYACLLALWYLAHLKLFLNNFMISDTYGNAILMIRFHPKFIQLLAPISTRPPQFTSALVRIHPAVGLPIITAVLSLCLIAYKKLYNVPQKKWVHPLLIIFFIAFYLAWSPTNLWAWLPKQLLAGQYCWRILSQVIWIGALLYALAVSWCLNKKIKSIYISVISLLIISTSLTWLPTKVLAIISSTDLIKRPLLLYNNNAYLLNFLQNPTIVSRIDNIRITPDESLKLNFPYLINDKLLALTYSPQLILTGNISDALLHHEIMVSNNNVILQKIKPNTNKFKWIIPFKKNENTSASIKFTSTDGNHKISLDGFLLTGFLDNNKTLTVENVQPHCHLIHALTQCSIGVNKNIELIELPILYHPQMISITINNKPVPYESVLYKGYLIVGIKPQQGTNNVINIQFTGLEWANGISEIAWGLWIIIFIIATKDYIHASLLQRIKKPIL
ncbi:MAG: hypothetical protein P4M12_04490 [Gammaproteobacteria bacterium]|nr:hypothetical protein [Gammaproteobacteria bacterium]